MRGLTFFAGVAAIVLATLAVREFVIYVPAPAPTELEQLRSRVAELEGRLLTVERYIQETFAEERQSQQDETMKAIADGAPRMMGKGTRRPAGEPR